MKQKMRQQGKHGMKRRGFLKKAAAGATGVAAATVAAPAISQGRQEIVMVSTWPRDLPSLGTNAQRFAQRLTDMTDGRLNVQYFASGERVKRSTRSTRSPPGTPTSITGPSTTGKASIPASRTSPRCRSA